MALFFGLQSMHAYAVFGWFALLWRDSGYSPGQAGALVGVVAAVSIPLSLWAPSVAGGRPPAGSCSRSCLLPGGLPRADRPCTPGVLWALLSGRGLHLPDRADPDRAALAHAGGTAALSGFTQSIGYLLAAVGPFRVGALTTPPAAGPRRCCC